jgi:hypothetical protein
MNVALRFITLDYLSSSRLAGFWAAALGSAVVADEEWGAVVQSADLTVPGLYLQPVPEPKSTKNRMHLDLWVDRRGPGGQRVLCGRAHDCQLVTSFQYESLRVTLPSAARSNRSQPRTLTCSPSGVVPVSNHLETAWPPQAQCSSSP